MGYNRGINAVKRNYRPLSPEVFSLLHMYFMTLPIQSMCQFEDFGGFSVENSNVFVVVRICIMC